MKTGTVTLPRVTEILTRVGLALDYEKLLPAEKLLMLRQRGTALHQAIQYLDRGTLDLATVHPAILPGLEAYQAWAHDVHHEAWESELEVVHPEWHFVGHPDRIGTVHGEPAVIDWKYSESPDLRGGRYQLAGYKLLANALLDEDTGMPRWHNLIHECYLVQLSPTGKGYRMHRLTDANADQVFLAAVILHRALREVE